MKKRIPLLISMAVHVLFLLLCIGLLALCLDGFETPPAYEYEGEGPNYGGLVIALLLMFGVAFSVGGTACMAGLLFFEIVDLIFYKKGFGVVSLIGNIALSFASGALGVSLLADRIQTGEGVAFIPVAILFLLCVTALVASMVRLTKKYE